MMFPLLAGLMATVLVDTASADSVNKAARTVASRTPRPAAAALRADSIVVEKKRRRLTLYLDGKPVKHYGVALGKNPAGRKLQIGDFRTPEGVYFIEGRLPQSQYYRALRISYPDQLDRLRANSIGLTAGGDIMIHGLPNGRASLGAAHRRTDWTEGCIAVTNEEIDEIWSAVPDGAPIEIKP